ncbi:hypothetical protein GCM10011352_26700 [Marinobacterium zhoushanense]|uniref:Uncharacterized protein n=1 Tax=Marinobacterium zhoushanense TaxID=1679163 RepID=A0ABQ1KKA8_9GAMM|nr:hypothetical protein [Marinobacterium zhoushanense]GGB99184.1 hypothetical protein GCM10011352_26700 [Marinobacterium zhoushanense]
MALANEMEVEAFAQCLTECADAIHERIKAAIKNREIERDQAQSMFQEESLLRQRANGLYIDAANSVVAGLTEPQDALLAAIDNANDRIQQIKEIAGFIDLVTDLAVLAAAVSAAKPAPILAALKEVKEDVDAVNSQHS